MKRESSRFYPAGAIERVRTNAVKYAWAGEAQREIVEAARPWMGFSDEELWGLMFGNTLRRSWMVWSGGHCPACGGGVPMYQWEIDALARPWKVRCPNCQELFPKNDFAAFYRSGLDAHGVFDPAAADRSLLFNAAHPDPKDPKHGFGVDDGNGYAEGEKRWWFVATYLVYGQWKQAVHGGLCKLAAAYAVTGERGYAHRAGILLDRVADLYPSFDFKEEGVMYEGPGHAGYVSTWHDACEETRELALAYDQVREALAEDENLVRFLGEQAKRYGLPNAKASAGDVIRNIEAGILAHPLEHDERIQSNYPRKQIALLVIRTVLGWPRNRDEVMGLMDEMIERATAVDGVTGEKGMAGYSAGVIQSLAAFLEAFGRIEPGFLAEVFERHPKLKQTWRFHIDTWCLQQYYPQAGDTGGFARPAPQYVGVGFSKQPGLWASMFHFLWRLYELTGDPAYVQVLYGANGNAAAGLPYDLFAEDPEAFQRDVRGVIERAGTELRTGSVNKTAWHLAVLRAGRGEDRRAVWLDYDAGGGHGHADGMNLGLFAKGLDLMPDFGYPPVHYGGWKGPKFHWYVSTASHNTVEIDGRDQARPSAGESKLWAAGEAFRAIRASGPELYGVSQYERTVAMADLSERDSYVVEVFRVVGGTDHAKFVHSHFGRMTTQGLSLTPAEDYGYETQMRNFSRDASPEAGWYADWTAEDRRGILPAPRDLHLRYTDLTAGAEAFTAEAWVSMGNQTYEDAWIPRVMVRRKAAEAPLASTFVGVIEPYEGASGIGGARRLGLETAEGAAYPDANVAVEVLLADGRKDLFVSADVENPLGLRPSRAESGTLVQKDWEVRLDGEACFVRKGKDGRVERIALCNGRSVRVGTVEVAFEAETDFVEVRVEDGRPVVVAGRAGVGR